MPFGDVNAQLDLVALEERVLARWRADDIPGRVAQARKDAPPWIFYEGPPTANGRPGLHHVWARVFKDLFPRFQTMRGHAVPRKGGWDCHGLPVELEIEKALGLHSKHEIEAYGIAEFNQRCRDSVHRYVEDWTSLTGRSGTWIDTKDAYWTLTNDYVESVWWLVRQMWDKGLLYEGHRVVPYCGRCGTALSSHEVAQGYRDITDPSVYVRFPLTSAPAGFEGADLLVWTTTPWTLVSNVGAAVGPDITYVRIADPAGGRDLVLAEPAARQRRYPEADRHRDAAWRRPGRGPLHPAVRRAAARHRRGRRQRPAGGGRRLRHHRRRLGHRAPRSGLRRGRLDRRPRRGPAGAQPGRRGRRLRPHRAHPHRPLREGRRPRPHRRPDRPGHPRGRAGLRAQLPPLLALRHPAHLLGQDLVVRPHLGTPRRDAARERAHRLASRAPQARPIRQLARGQRRLGPVPRPLLGHAPAHLALRGLRPRHLHRLGGRTERAQRPRPVRPRPAPPVRRRCHLPLHRRRLHGQGPPARAGPRCLVRLGFDAHGATPPPVRGGRQPRRGLSGRLHLRSHRPDPRLVLLTAGRQHPGVRLHPVPRRRLPRPHRRRGRAEDVEVQGQRHRPVDDLRHVRRRRPALVLLLRRAAVDAAPGLRGRHPRDHPPDADHPLERVRLPRPVRRHRWLGAGRPPPRARPTPSTAGCSASSTPPSPR